MGDSSKHESRSARDSENGTRDHYKGRFYSGMEIDLCEFCTFTPPDEDGYANDEEQRRQQVEKC
jgi:hypothetical protein